MGLTPAQMANMPIDLMGNQGEDDWIGDKIINQF